MVKDDPKDDDETYPYIQAMLAETIGSMLITFLYLTQTEEKTKMSSDPAITTLIISATYAAVVGMGEKYPVMSGSPYNPAASCGLMFAIIFKGDVEKAKGVWIFLFFAYGGAALAVLLFECVYKKAMAVVENRGDVDDDDDEGAEHDALMPPVDPIDQ